MPYARTWKHPSIKMIHRGITIYHTYIDDMEDFGVREGVYTRDPQLARYEGRDFSLREFDIPSAVGDPADRNQHDGILLWLIDQGMLDKYPTGGLSVWDTWNIYVESTFGGVKEILADSLVEWAEAMERPAFRTYADVDGYPHGFVALGIDHGNLLVYPRSDREGYFDLTRPKTLHWASIQELTDGLRAAASSIRRTVAELETYLDAIEA